jgi:hypothetical protein
MLATATSRKTAAAAGARKKFVYFSNILFYVIYRDIS